MVNRRRLFLGGVPGLRAGDLFEPRHRHRPGKPSRHPHRVFATTDRLYAKHFASLRGGDLYRVHLLGDWAPSLEDPVESFHAPAARVAAVLDRAVWLTHSERRRLVRRIGGTA